MLSKKEAFVVSAKAVHGDRYNYDGVVYINTKVKVSIVCPMHGTFLQEPRSHVYLKCGCRQCAIEERNKRLTSTTETFVGKAKALHGDRYDYNKVVYANNRTPVTIGCQEHGAFEQTPNAHLLGNGCPLCGGRVQLTTEGFVEKARAVHGELYDYSQTVYTTAKTPVKIGCRKHGLFSQIPNNHTQGAGCYLCARRIIVSPEEFVEKAKAQHGDTYLYDQMGYSDMHSYVTIGCKAHGYFKQVGHEHLRGRGCKLCSEELLGTVKLTTDVFVERSKIVHDGLYDYSEVDYVNAVTPVKIICSKHGVFEQKPTNHLKGSGCLTCKSSKGEITIAKILRKHTIPFTQEYHIPDQNRRLKYDFHVPSLNLLIEFHGVQHYQPVEFFGGEAGFASVKVRDAVKKAVAKLCGYRFVEINYTQLLNLSEEEFEEKLLRNLNRFSKPR